MNKKLVAFLLSTGILVSTCGTAFANEVVVNDNIPNNTVNTVSPNYINNLITQINKSIDELNKIANELSQIPVANEDDIAKLGEMTDKYIEQLNKATTEADIELIIDDFNKTTKEFVATSGVANRNLTILNDLYREAEVQYKNIHDLLDKLVTVNGSGTAVLELSQQAIELSKSINKIYDTKNSESNKHINNITNELSKCQEKIKKISADITLDGMQNVITDTSNMNNMIDNNVTNLPNNNMINSPNNNATEEPTTDKKDEDNKDEDKPPVDFSNEYIDDDDNKDEEEKDVDLPPFPISGDMQKEIDQLLKDYRAEYEKLLSNVSTVKNTETSRQSGRLIDKYNEQVIDIHEKYYNIFDENSNILGNLYLKCDLKYENYKAEMDKYDKYLREIDNIEEEALDDLDRIDEEYSDKIDKAYEALDKKTTNTTSTVSESGSKMGSSSGSSTSYSSTGNPKTGDYTTLGASIATMIAGIAGIFVSRKR